MEINHDRLLTVAHGDDQYILQVNGYTIATCGRNNPWGAEMIKQTHIGLCRCGNVFPETDDVDRMTPSI